MSSEDSTVDMPSPGVMAPVDAEGHRFPFCIVWTPLPVFTWLFPFIGHMGIATSRGVIRDFAGSYYVAEDNMGFSWPTLYWQLDPKQIPGGFEAYDRAVREASDEYKTHMHNIFCDNCHSHVAYALNAMSYAGKNNWNMVNLAFLILLKGRFVGLSGFLKQYLPAIVLLSLLGCILYMTSRV